MACISKRVASRSSAQHLEATPRVLHEVSGFGVKEKKRPKKMGTSPAESHQHCEKVAAHNIWRKAEGSGFG